MEVYELKPYGYCFGVIQAIELIKEVKQKHYDKNIYVFGMLVHNNDVVTYLNSLGITTIDTNSIDKVQKLKEFTSDDVVVFTAHGHDERYHLFLEKNNVIYYDATCKNVRSSIDLIKTKLKDHQIIYVGKKNHPETEACLSISKDVVLYDINKGMDYSKITCSNPFVVNQTTLSILELSKVHEDIKSKYHDAYIADEICSQTRIRQQNIMNFDKKVDLALVIGSIHSSNTDKLYQLCKIKFPSSVVLKVDNLTMLKEHNLEGINSCVLTSGTSTPLESIIEIKEYLLRS